MPQTRCDDIIRQEWDELIKKLPPYSLSSPAQGKTTLHDFVKGLIIAGSIIDFIQSKLPDGFRVDWGQIIDPVDGNLFSNECDIIIYEGKPYKEFNNKSMKFVLIDKRKANAIIQVKSSIDSVTEDDKKYCCNLKKFVSRIWYFAENCITTNPKRLKKQLKKCGYNKFFYFTQVHPTTLNKHINYSQATEFVNLIRDFQ